MEDFDVKEIRNHLPVGAITEIAERLKTSTITISNIFNRGVIGKYRNAAVALALQMIEDKKTSPELLKKAKDLKMTTSSLYSIPYTRKKKRKDEGSRDSGILGIGIPALIGIVAAAGIGLFFWFKNKAKVGGTSWNQ